MYEEAGQGYLFGYVRWTEQRNFEAILDMLVDGQLDVGPLITHRFDLEQAEQAYQVVGGSEPSLGILLEYPGVDEKSDEQLRKRILPLWRVARSIVTSPSGRRLG